LHGICPRTRSRGGAFDLNEAGPAAFYAALTADIYVLVAAESFITAIGILTSMKGVSVFIAIAIIADIIEVSRFRDSKHFAGYPRSVPRAAASNMAVKNRGTNKMGRKLSAALLTRPLNHVINSSGKLWRWYDRYGMTE
jgi:transposase